jgi:hypothetical protein
MKSALEYIKYNPKTRELTYKYRDIGFRWWKK